MSNWESWIVSKSVTNVIVAVLDQPQNIPIRYCLPVVPSEDSSRRLEKIDTDNLSVGGVQIPESILIFLPLEMPCSIVVAMEIFVLVV